MSKERAKEVMAEDKGVPSMAVENVSATQRELAYRQKIANLFPDGNLEDMLPFEEKLRKKALISKNKISADAIKDCSPTTTCNKTGTIFRIHSNVPRRKVLISKNNMSTGRRENAESSNSGCQPQLQHKPNIIRGPMGFHYCKICRVHCSGALCYELHLRGQKHKAKLQCWQDPSFQRRNKQIRCDLCKIYCQDKALLEVHLKGQKHKAKQQELQHGDKIKDESSQLFWCELCQVPCMNEETYALHLKGKKHIKHLYDRTGTSHQGEKPDNC